MSTSTVQLRLQLTGQQAQQQLQRLNLQQNQAQQQQKQNLNQLLNIQQRINSSTQQGGKYGQQQLRTGQSMVQTNRLLAQILQQQQRQTSTITQQLRQQQSSYQLQLNTLRQQVAAAERLRQQLQQAGQAQRDIQRGGTGGNVGVGRNVLGAVTGAVAGYHATNAIVTPPIERGRNFYRQVFNASAAMTDGFKGMDTTQAKAFNAQMQDLAKQGVRAGGTLEGTSSAIGNLAASGDYKTIEDMREPIMAIVKTAFAADASELDISSIVRQLNKNGIEKSRTQAVLDRLVASGNAGSFEIADMAQFAPEVLSAASRVGYTGERGTHQVFTQLQMARDFTATGGEAATNMSNLYGLFTQDFFQKRLGKLVGMKEDEVEQYILKNTENGVDIVQSVAKLMSGQLNKNSEYRRLNEQITIAEKTGDTETQARLKGTLEQLIGFQFGEVFREKTSLQGMAAQVRGVESGKYESVDTSSWNATGATDRLAAIRGAEDFAIAAALVEEKILTQVKIYDDVNNSLGNFNQGLINFMQGNERLVADLTIASGALLGLATVAGMTALSLRMMGGGGDGLGGGRNGRGGRGGRGGALRSILFSDPRLMTGTAARIGVGAGLAGAGLFGWEAGSFLNRRYIEGTDFGHNLGGMMATIISNMPDWMGGATAREALEAEMNYLSGMTEQQTQQNDELIKKQTEQNQLSKDLSGKLDTLINVTSQNKPIPYAPSGNALLDAVSGAASKEANRYGAVPISPLKGLGG